MSRLSFVLTKYEYAIRKLQNEVADGLHMQDDILKLLPPIEVVHRGTTRLVSRPNILDRSPKPHKTKFSVDPDMFLRTDAIKFRGLLLDLNTDLQKQQKMHTIESMLETGEAAGNSIDAGGRNLWDAYIEMLQKAPYQEHGYTLYMHPDTEKNMRETPPTDEQRQKIKDVNKAKREEFLANRRSRRLT